MNNWHKDDPPRDTSETWLSLKKVEPGIDGTWNDAYAKWDGCAHYTRYFNAPREMQEAAPEDADGLHICSIPEMVADLLDIAERAREHFGADWDGASRLEDVLASRGWVRAP